MKLNYRRLWIRVYLFFGIVGPVSMFVVVGTLLAPEAWFTSAERIAHLHTALTGITLSLIVMLLISRFLSCQICGSRLLYRGLAFGKRQKWQKRRWYVDLDTVSCPACGSGVGF
jgi:DNA-directed RNA polymerase subunit RPC12/RpoP